MAVGWLHGLQAGVELPLFNKQSKQKIEAQKLQIEVGKAVVEAEKLQFQQELLSIDNALKLYEAGVLLREYHNLIIRLVKFLI